MKRVGIIANPASGRDIRRLVALGAVIGIQEKVNIVQRILAGLEATEVDEVYIMPDAYDIGRQALHNLSRRGGVLADRVRILGSPLYHGPRDSVQAAIDMRERGVACIITLGGDGTNRVVAKGCGEVPLLPVSTGTNNVISYMVEGTLAGLAAGFVAEHQGEIQKFGYRSKKLEVRRDGEPPDLALVDVAVVEGRFVGARAVWDASLLNQIIVTRGMPDSIGLSSLAGYVHPVDPRDEIGLQVLLDKANPPSVTFPLAPGVMAAVGVRKVRELTPGQVIDIEDAPCILALDGEREIPLGPGTRASVELRRDGPWIVDVHQALRHAVGQGPFLRLDS